MRSLFTLLLLCYFPLAVFGQKNAVKPKLSPLTRHYLHMLDKQPSVLPKGYVYNKTTSGNVYISALIKVSDKSLADKGLNSIGAHIGTKAGHVWTVRLPIDQVRAFCDLDGIQYIQLDEPNYPDLDQARKTTRADSAQAGYGLPMGYSGAGVVMGVIDFGFDYNHPTFYDTFGTAYRVKRVWEMESTGTPPAGYTYGRELTDSNAIRAAGTDNTLETHGSSTTGMAAGSGFGSPNSGRKYRGFAYQSDIVWVGVRRDSIGGQWMQGSFTDFIDGLNYIFSYANSVGKPAVVNISWGSHSGAHDGTSLFNEACDSLSGPGKIIVMSAGNEGEENIHLSKTFTATDTVLKTYLTFTPATYRRTWVDIWGQPGKTFCVKTTLYHNGIAGQTTGFHCIDDNVTDTFLIGSNGTDTCSVEYITSSAEPTNNKPRVTVNIFNKSTDSVGIEVKGASGSINMWDEYYYYGFPYQYQSAFDSLDDPTAVSGNTITTVSDMGSAQSVLLVGAYASKIGFTDINGHSWTYSGYVLTNRLVPFSSRGPMIDGRIKPDLTAPGLTISTATSSYDTSYTETGSNSDYVDSKYTFNGHDYYYAEFSGTSASAPAASGIVAMLLQADPTLTPDSVKYYLFATAITDAYTGTLPAAGNNNWGHGKINAYESLKMLVQSTGLYSFSGRKLDCVLFPNPNNGHFTLDYTGSQSEGLNISVRSVTGREVYRRPWNVASGFNRTQLDLSNVAKGMYVVDITGIGGSLAIKAVVE